MKSKLLTIIAVAAAVLTGCDNDTYTPIEETIGQLDLSEIAIQVVNDPLVIESRSGIDSVDVSSYIVTISSTNNGSKVGEWTYSNLPQSLTLPQGVYELTVENAKSEPAAWEKPYYAASKTFSIKTNETTTLGCTTCTMAAVKVTVGYAPDLLRRLEGDAKVEISCGDGTLTFAQDEQRAAYFVPSEGVTTLVANFSATVKGQNVTFRKVFGDIARGQHRIITLYARNGADELPQETGSINAALTIDATMTEEHYDANLDVQEPVINPSQPSDPNSFSFTSPTIDFFNPNGVDGDSYIVGIQAVKGIAHLTVKIVSDNDNFMAAVSDLLPIYFDLAYPQGREEDFESLGLPVGKDVIGKTDIEVDLSQFIPLLKSYPGTHHFIVTVSSPDGSSDARDVTFMS